jgi:hypothetical protein
MGKDLWLEEWTVKRVIKFFAGVLISVRTFRSASQIKITLFLLIFSDILHTYYLLIS